MYKRHRTHRISGNVNDNSSNSPSGVSVACDTVTGDTSLLSPRASISSSTSDACETATTTSTSTSVGSDTLPPGPASGSATSTATIASRSPLHNHSTVHSGNKVQPKSVYISVSNRASNRTPHSSLIEAVAPRTTTDDVTEDSASQHARSKRIHLNISECLEHSQSEEGGRTLTDPTQVVKSSKDPNRGMYPREAKVRRPLRCASESSFVKASEITPVLPELNPPLSDHKPLHSHPQAQAEYNTQYQNYDHSWNRGKRKRKMIGNQSNTLKTYFSQSKPPTDSAKHNEEDDCIPASLCSNFTSNKVCEPRTFSSELMYKTQYVVTSPNLPTLPETLNTISLNSQQLQVLPCQKMLNPKTFGKGKATSKGKIKAPPKSIGPSAHCLRKATFLYDNSLAKPEKPTTKTVDKYGLLGSGNYPHSCKQTGGLSSYFHTLPYDIIENIFCRLPMMDLFLNVNRVCSRWNNIISDDKFLPWKKQYYRLKASQMGTKALMKTIMTDSNMTTIDEALPQLIRYMGTFKKMKPTNISECLQRHSKYDYARTLLKSRFEDVIGTDELANPWCVIAALVVVSEYVSDVTEICEVLLSRRSLCPCYVVIECLYCLATFLLAFTNEKRGVCWNGMHYRVYYALYLLENLSTTTSDQLQDATSHGQGGQQSLIKYTSGSTIMQMTHEQLRICSHNVKDGDTVKIIAFAGTGKTTTLVKYTQLRPNLRFLLLVYNKSVQIHAKSKFPMNVKCLTGHALAFARVGRRYAAKQMLGSNLKVSAILDHFTACKGESLYVQAKFIIKTLEKFMASADPCVTTAHVPEESTDDNGVRKEISEEHRMHYLEQASQIWDKMIDLNDSSLKITHDTYLKLYQLEKTRIWDCDIILIDEAQDMTPALADVLLSQRQAKILVGDPHQQIYAFRGAVNAMQEIPNVHTFYLTQSFRFGSQIAFVASSCLSVLKKEAKTLVGNASTGCIRGRTEGQLAIITRSNFTLFKEAVKECCLTEKTQTVAFVGGTESFGFDMILDIYSLMAEGKHTIKNKFIEGFQSVHELERYAKKTGDTELCGKIKIVNTYNHQLPALIRRIRARCINDTDLADVVLSTAHKAKGLEFSTVRLTDDYLPDLLEHLSLHDASLDSADETNLLYVAATRAKKSLILTPTLKVVLDFAGERFRYPVLTKTLVLEGMAVNCSGEESAPGPLSVVQRGVGAGGDIEKKDKVYSPQKVYFEMPAMRDLYGKPEPWPEGVDLHQFLMIPLWNNADEY